MAENEPGGRAGGPKHHDEGTFRPIATPPPTLGPSSPVSTPDQIFKPRWKPWSPRKVVAFTLAFGAIMGALVLLFPRLVSLTKVHLLHTAKSAPVVAEEPLITVGPPAAAAVERADAALVRKGRSPIAGGVLTILPGFASADGRYDLVIHFHGNTDLVEESYARLPLDAVVLIMNLGTGSGPYEDRFANPLVLPEILGRVQATLEKRGLRNPTRNRLALSAWSAGYGAVLRVLDHAALADQVDAVVLLDGIHCGYQPGTTTLIPERLAPFERFARAAMEGKKLFSITHSEITPVGHYAGTKETTDALLQRLGVARTPGGETPPQLALASIDGVIARKAIRPLVPRSEAVSGGLHVRGYAGAEPETHSMHLIEMSVTALPDLVHHWAAPAGSMR